MGIESSHSPVRSVRPVAPYLGGKRNLAKRICAAIEATPHAIYAEPFVGMGGVFLRRETAPKSEVINDLNREVATFFRILQRHYVAFMEMIKFQLTTRAEFERLVDTSPDTLTDLERSARFLYLQRTAFGGKVSGSNFGVSPSNPARFDITKLGPMLEDLHTRLAGVVIECLPYGDFITRYDRPETLFYLDPPYWGCEGDYGKHLFERADLAKADDPRCLTATLRLDGGMTAGIGLMRGVDAPPFGPADREMFALFIPHLERALRLQRRFAPANSGGTQFHLSPRQREVLTLGFQGLRSKEIATRLGLSVRTVEHHFTEAAVGLNASGRSQAIAIAVDLGLITKSEED
jgi:DNA adenine methylase